MLKKIQAKPDHVKKRISLALTIVIFGGIVFVWLSSWDARTASDESREMTASPTESFKEIFADMVSEMKNSFSSAPFSGDNEIVEAGSKNALSSLQATSAPPAFDMSGVVIIDLATSTASKEAR